MGNVLQNLLVLNAKLTQSFYCSDIIYSLSSLYAESWLDFLHLAIKYPNKTIITNPPNTAPTIIGIKSFGAGGPDVVDPVLLDGLVVWVVTVLWVVVCVVFLVPVVVGEVFLLVLWVVVGVVFLGVVFVVVGVVFEVEVFVVVGVVFAFVVWVVVAVVFLEVV